MPINSRTWRDPIPDIVEETLKAVEVLSRERLWAHALACLYSSIDHLTWIDAPADADMTTGPMFEAWVNRYMLDGSELPCDAQELYQSRCYVLHQRIGSLRRTTETRSKDARPYLREIYYVVPGETIESLRVRSSGEPGLVVVELSVLLDAFKTAAMRLRDEIDREPQRRERAVGRAVQWLRGLRPGEVSVE